MKQLLFISLLALMACKGGGDNSSAAVDPVYGDWYYQAPGSTSTQAKGIIAHLDASGIQFSNGYVYASNGSATYYVRKNIGTYVRDGESFNITYSYETCDPIHQETLKIKMNGDKLMVATNDGSFVVVMSRISSEESSIKTAAVVEDKNCNILSKIEKAQARVPASSKSKSFFARVIK